MENQTPLKLEVGKTYEDGYGNTVYIKYRELSAAPLYKGSDGKQDAWYNEKGQCNSPYHRFDLIKEVN